MSKWKVSKKSLTMSPFALLQSLPIEIWFTQRAVVKARAVNNEDIKQFLKNSSEITLSSTFHGWNKLFKYYEWLSGADKSFEKPSRCWIKLLEHFERFSRAGLRSYRTLQGYLELPKYSQSLSKG